MDLFKINLEKGTKLYHGSKEKIKYNKYEQLKISGGKKKSKIMDPTKNKQLWKIGKDM